MIAHQVVTTTRTSGKHMCKYSYLNIPIRVFTHTHTHTRNQYLRDKWRSSISKRDANGTIVVNSTIIDIYNHRCIHDSFSTCTCAKEHMLANVFNVWYDSSAHSDSCLNGWTCGNIAVAPIDAARSVLVSFSVTKPKPRVC